MDIKRSSNEDKRSYIVRVCSKKHELGTWQDVADIVNRELGLNHTESWYRKKFGRISDSRYMAEEYRNDIDRKKNQTYRLEINRLLREYARSEILHENIVEAIQSLSPVSVPDYLGEHNSGERIGLLLFGDEHYGSEFSIKGLHGELINSYSPKIFESRMWTVLRRAVSIIRENKLSETHVYSLGDFADGILRTGQLMQLRYGVIESTIRYAHFLSTWLSELSKYTHVKFHMTHGNHTELRMIGQPKGTFKDENVGKIVLDFLQERLAEHDRIEICEEHTDHIFETVFGLNILGVHGDMKNVRDAIDDYSRIYKTPVDILIHGHFHHQESKNIAIDSDIIGVPSIMGVNDFSMSLRSTANAGATFLILTSDEGKYCEYSIRVR